MALKSATRNFGRVIDCSTEFPHIRSHEREADSNRAASLRSATLVVDWTHYPAEQKAAFGQLGSNPQGHP